MRIDPCRYPLLVLVLTVGHATIGATSADDISPLRGLTITSIGEASAKADSIRIRLLSAGTAKTWDSALDECREHTRAATQAIEALDIPNAIVRTPMYQFSNPYGVRQRRAANSDTQVTQPIIVTITTLRELDEDDLAPMITKILDVAIESGAGMVQPEYWDGLIPRALHSVEYTCDDESRLRLDAIRDAIRKSKVQKESYEAAGMKIGKLLSVEQAGPDATRRKNAYAHMDASTISSTDPEKVTAAIAVTMTYEILPE